MAEGINHLLNLSHHCMPLDTMQTGFFLDSSSWGPGVKVKVVVLSLLSYDGIRFFFSLCLHILNSCPYKYRLLGETYAPLFISTVKHFPCPFIGNVCTVCQHVSFLRLPLICNPESIFFGF